MDKAHFGQGPPWSAIKEAIEKTNGRVIAAVSYVGKDAATVLPLHENDLLVCDASDLTVRAGSTRPEGLRALHARGVEIHSIQGLHAKVVVLPRSTFVGSMNASARSSKELYEAVIESTDPVVRRQLRSWVEAFKTRPLTRAEIERLAKIAPVNDRKGWPPPAHAAELPKPLNQLLFITQGLVSEDWTKASEKAYDREEPAARAEARSALPGCRIRALEFDEPMLGRLVPGRWACLSRTEPRGLLYQPAVVVRRTKAVRGWGVVWLSEPKVAKRTVSRRAAFELLHALGKSSNRQVVSLKDSDAEAMAALFR
jgi:hypothetical protein